MPTILREDQQARIDELVRQGAYADPAAALDDALALAERKARFQALVQEGIDDLNAGRVYDHETVMRDVRQKIAEIAAQRGSPAASP
jgi:predicted transcriptional regulator